MDLLLTIISFISIIMLLVFVHELGHFLVARFFGVYVEVFSIGFGKKLFSWKDSKETVWQIAPIPLGGYVKMYGEFYPTQKTKMQKISTTLKKSAFVFKPLYQRALIVFAGPLANFVFAALCFSAIYSFQGFPVSAPIVDQVIENGPAYKAGIKAGDVIKKIDGKTVTRFQDVQEIVFYSPNKDLFMTLQRANKLLDLTVRPEKRLVVDVFGNEQNIGFLGITGKSVVYEKSGWVRSFYQGTKDVGEFSVQMLKAVSKIITGKQGTEDIGSVLRIADMSSKVTKAGLTATIWFIAILSINLGLINLFPIPVLDGGHLMFYLIEAITRRPVSAKIYMIANKIGVLLLMALMIFAISNDVLFFISK